MKCYLIKSVLEWVDVETVSVELHTDTSLNRVHKMLDFLEYACDIEMKPITTVSYHLNGELIETKTSAPKKYRQLYFGPYEESISIDKLRHIYKSYIEEISESDAVVLQKLGFDGFGNYCLYDELCYWFLVVFGLEDFKDIPEFFRLLGDDKKYLDDYETTFKEIIRPYLWGKMTQLEK